MILRLFFFALALVFFSPKAQAQTTLNRIRQSGVVRCGARTNANAFAYLDKEKGWRGIDVELCKIVAAAVLGNEEAIEIIPTNSEQGFAMLASYQIDILGAATPYTMNLELNSDALMPAVFYYTSLGFIARHKPQASSMRDYQGANVCVEASPFLLYELEKYNKQHELNLRIMKMPTLEKAKEFLYLNRCELIFDRTETFYSDYFKKTPQNIEISPLPEVVRPYATGPYIRDDDKVFFKMMKWLIYALIKAEEKEITAQNIEDFKNTQDLEIQNLLFENTHEAMKLGLPSDWIYRTISLRGNYAEIYERAFGALSHLNLKRTKSNLLLQEGGKITAPRFEK